MEDKRKIKIIKKIYQNNFKGVSHHDKRIPTTVA